MSRPVPTTTKDFVAVSDLPKSPGHPFYAAPNRLLAANGFDLLVAHSEQRPRAIGA